MLVPSSHFRGLLTICFASVLVLALSVCLEHAKATSQLQVTPEWSTQSSGTAEVLLGVSFTDSSHGYAVGTNGVIRTTANAGASWSPLTSGTSRFLRDVYFSDATHGVI